MYLLLDPRNNGKCYIGRSLTAQKTHITQIKGKTYEEVYGKERALEIKQKLKTSHQGKTPSMETRLKMSIARQNKNK
jgi:hypothetical protein